MGGGVFGIEQAIPVSQTMFSLPIINSLMIPNKREVQSFEEIPLDQLNENIIPLHNLFGCFHYLKLLVEVSVIL